MLDSLNVSKIFLETFFLYTRKFYPFYSYFHDIHIHCFFLFFLVVWKNYYWDFTGHNSVAELSTKELQQLAVQLRIQVQKVIDLLWLFLELHMLKLMLLSIMLLCVFDVCAVHFLFMLLAVIALSFGSKTHTLVCHVVAVLVSILLLLKMIYQINYFMHENYQVNCTVRIFRWLKFLFSSIWLW